MDENVEVKPLIAANAMSRRIKELQREVEIAWGEYLAEAKTTVWGSLFGVNEKELRRKFEEEDEVLDIKYTMGLLVDGATKVKHSIMHGTPAGISWDLYSLISREYEDLFSEYQEEAVSVPSTPEPFHNP